MARNTAFTKNSRLTTLRWVYPDKKRFMRISEEAYQRLRQNSEKYGDRESFSEIIIRLVDFYEANVNNVYKLNFSIN